MASFSIEDEGLFFSQKSQMDINSDNKLPAYSDISDDEDFEIPLSQNTQRIRYSYLLHNLAIVGWGLCFVLSFCLFWSVLGSNCN